MDILVLVKYAPERAGPLAVDQDTRQVVETGVVYGLGPYDLMALEDALSLKDKHGGAVTAVTLGPAKDEEGLREAMAMGADRAIRVWHPELSSVDDPWLVAGVLAQACRSLRYDVVLGGVRSAGVSSGLVVTYLASILNIPVVNGVVSVEYKTNSNELLLQRNAGKGDRWVLECRLPAALGIEKSGSEPRYPTMYGRLAAAGATVSVWEIDPGAGEPPEPLTELIGLTKARPKPKKIFTPDSNLSAADRMKMILSGGVSKKKGPTGTASEGAAGARQLYDYLKQAGILKS
ncbi:hypothetical protein SY88_15875 [Clostridiales bacterium PH28_bin88]|nr:hypothetical protein SY88_15875 [Clostridiales bacterium PH28_bin88]